MGHIGAMKLLDHLKAVGKQVPEFADDIGESRNTIRKIAYGQRQPSLELAVKITHATGGIVTAADMVLPEQAAAA
jgi:DNA-binding XRE family transcriptional regulator